MLYFILIAIAVSQDAKMDVNLTIGLDFSDNSYLDFFSNFSKHFDEFHQNGLNVNIIQRLLPCYSCYKRHQFQQPEKNCLGGGRYCQYSDYASGQVILNELLRQQCILQVLPNHYFNYTIYFGEQCKQSTMVNCAQSYFTNNNISTEAIDTCVENSFEEGEEVNKEIRTNKILDQYKEMQYHQTSFSVYLDSSDKTNISYDEFLSMMCSKYINMSISFCKNTENPGKQKDYKNTFQQVLLFVFFLIILIITASGCWALLSKVHFGAILFPKSLIDIPKFEGPHYIIQEVYN